MLSERVDSHRSSYRYIVSLSDCNCRWLDNRSDIVVEVYVPCVGVQNQITLAVQCRGERDRTVRAVVVHIAVHRHIRMQVHRTGKSDVAVVAQVGGTVVFATAQRPLSVVDSAAG